MKLILKDLLGLLYGERDYSEKEIRWFGIILSVLIVIGIIFSYSKLF